MILTKLTLIETIYENLEVKDIDVAANIVDSLLGLGNVSPEVVVPPAVVDDLIVITMPDVPRSNVGEEYIVNIENFVDAGSADEVGMLLTSEFYEHVIQTTKPQAPINGAVAVASADSVNISVTVSDPLDRAMSVSIYDALDDSRIAIMNNVASGATVTTEWSGLEQDEQYRYYARATDPEGNVSDCSNFFCFVMSSGSGTIAVSEMVPINVISHSKKQMITADAGVGNYKFSFNRLAGTTDHFYRAYAIKDSVVKYGKIYSVLTIPETYLYESKVADVSVTAILVDVANLNIPLLINDILIRNIAVATTTDSDTDVLSIQNISVSIPTKNNISFAVNQAMTTEISYGT